MNILVTGSKGQLGNEILDMIKTGRAEIGPISDCYQNCKVFKTDISELDICNLSTVRDFCKNNRIDLIINCAAYTDVDGCEINKESAFKVNVLGPRNLAIVSSETNAKLVHISTDYVFSGETNIPYLESDISDAKNIYGSTKYLGEQYVREMCNKYFLVRSSWLYGYVGKNFVKKIIKLACGKDEIKVVNDQRGNPTSANDLAYHILKICQTDEYGIYHCTGKGECTWFDFATKIVEFSGLSCKILPCISDEFPSPVKRPAYSSLDNMMLRCTVGNEMRDWQKALKEYIKNLRERNLI